MTKLLEHLKFDNLSKNESVNFEMVKPIGFFNEHNGTFIRNGTVLVHLENRPIIEPFRL